MFGISRKQGHLHGDPYITGYNLLGLGFRVYGVDIGVPNLGVQGRGCSSAM